MFVNVFAEKASEYLPIYWICWVQLWWIGNDWPHVRSVQHMERFMFSKLHKTWIQSVEITRTCWLSHNAGFQWSWRVLLKSFHCPSQYIPTEAQTKLFQPSTLHFIQWENSIWKHVRENLTNACVFPLWLSSRVNSYAPLFLFHCSELGFTRRHMCACMSRCCFHGNGGKRMKVIQNEHRRRTANYERGEGWRGWRSSSRRRRLVSSTATICPLVPSSHSPCLSTHCCFFLLLLFWVI